MTYGGGGSGGFPGSFHTGDVRGQGGGNRDSSKLPNEGLSQAEYETHIEHEIDDAQLGKKPPLIERFKRWFSTMF